MTTKLIITIILYFIVLSTGFWLNIQHKPYPILVTTVHKLCAVAAVILTVILTLAWHKSAAMPNWLIATAGLTGILSATGLVATGALLTIDKPMPFNMILAHKMFNLTFFISLAALLPVIVRFYR